MESMMKCYRIRGKTQAKQNHHSVKMETTKAEEAAVAEVAVDGAVVGAEVHPAAM